MERIKDCLSCSNSCSEPKEDNGVGYDRLYCVVHSEYVEENHCCDDYN